MARRNARRRPFLDWLLRAGLRVFAPLRDILLLRDELDGDGGLGNSAGLLVDDGDLQQVAAEGDVGGEAGFFDDEEVVAAVAGEVGDALGLVLPDGEAG